jgi:hypothetical protein
MSRWRHQSGRGYALLIELDGDVFRGESLLDFEVADTEGDGYGFKGIRCMVDELRDGAAGPWRRG